MVFFTNSRHFHANDFNINELLERLLHRVVREHINECEHEQFEVANKDRTDSCLQVVIKSLCGSRHRAKCLTWRLQSHTGRPYSSTPWGCKRDQKTEHQLHQLIIIHNSTFKKENHTSSWIPTLQLNPRRNTTLWRYHAELTWYITKMIEKVKRHTRTTWEIVIPNRPPPEPVDS